MIDPKQNDSIHPNIPLWGGAPFEWVSTESLNYTDVQKETLQDLMRQGMKLYIIPDREVWKKKIQGKITSSDKEAFAFLEEMSKNGEAISLSEGTQKEITSRHLSSRLSEGQKEGENTKTSPVSAKASPSPSFQKEI